MHRQMELAHLRLADRHIAEGALRIAAQADLVERLRAGKCPVEPAEDFLHLLRATMVGWHHHRRLILAALDEPTNDGFSAGLP
ncbi:MAG: hypothetical protein ACJ8EP_01590 [Sphingomicrobium sp.]